MEKTIEQIKEGLAKHYGYSDWLDMLRNSGDWSHDRYINDIAKEYASQFQINTDLVTTEVCVLRERVAELEGCLEGIYSELLAGDIENVDMKLTRIYSLINKGK